MIRSICFSVCLLLSLLASNSVHAQAKGYVGGLLGFSVPDYDHTSGRPGFGVIGGARLDGELGVGAFYITSSKEETNAGTKFKFDYSFYGLEGSFHFENIADGAFVAARVGLGKVDVGSNNISPFVWGLNFGYDYYLNEKFSLGIDAGFMNAQGGDDGNTHIKGFTALDFLVAAKLWL